MIVFMRVLLSAGAIISIAPLVWIAYVSFSSSENSLNIFHAFKNGLSFSNYKIILFHLRAISIKIVFFNE